MVRKKKIDMGQKEVRYLRHRKKTLVELRDLVFKRSKINTQIRKVQKELNAWDNVLLQ